MMDMNIESEETSGLNQLHELFNSCDVNGSGFLGKDELIDLCEKLALDDDQSDYILDHNCVNDDPIAKVSPTLM